MYLIYDMIGNKYLRNFNGLRDFLLEEIRTSVVDNREEKSWVVAGIDALERLCRNGNDIEFIKTELQEYGWYVMDTEKLRHDLNNLKEYVSRTENYKENFDPYLDSFTKLDDFLWAEINS